jgi:hypothetical protein
LERFRKISGVPNVTGNIGMPNSFGAIVRDSKDSDVIVLSYAAVFIEQ